MRVQKPKIVGGMFGLEVPRRGGGSGPKLLNGVWEGYANGRSAIAMLVERLSPRRIWLPSYMCGSILEALGTRKRTARFYSLDSDLKVMSDDWLQRVGRSDLVIIIDYFGFPLHADYALAARRRGAWVLEDACQALLTETAGRHGDFAVFSPRKFLGVPDGGILTSRRGRRGKGEAPRLESAPSEWWFRGFSAGVARGEFDRHGGSREWFEVYQEVERSQPVGRYVMSEFTRRVLEKWAGHRAAARRRVENYRCLSGALKEWALFPSLPAGVVPLGFPLRTRQRDRLRKWLFRHDIYPPVHWPLAGVVPKRYVESHRLASEILTIPCDQRYGIEDMARVARLARQVLAKGG